MAKFELYFADTETDGLDSELNSVIELSIYRLSDNKQRTWCLKPHSFEHTSMEALRVNHHKIEDLKHQTKFGQETYLEPSKVLPDIENFFLEDGLSSEDRILIGQNSMFDLNFLQTLWKREGCKDTFPFGSRPFIIDTRQIALFIDLIEDTRSEFYNLGTLIKKYGIKNSKAHTAAADTLATKELFISQMEYIKSKLK